MTAEEYAKLYNYLIADLTAEQQDKVRGLLELAFETGKVHGRGEYAGEELVKKGIN